MLGLKLNHVSKRGPWQWILGLTLLKTIKIEISSDVQPKYHTINNHTQTIYIYIKYYKNDNRALHILKEWRQRLWRKGVQNKIWDVQRRQIKKKIMYHCHCAAISSMASLMTRETTIHTCCMILLALLSLWFNCFMSLILILIDR